MPEINFRSLQNWHERLLQMQLGLSDENKQDIAKEVKEYIEQAKSGGTHISSNRERDQLRANLRYWANYLYGIDGTFPDTELAPSSVESKAFWTTYFGLLTILVSGIVILAGAGAFLFNRNINPATTETPINTETPTNTETALVQVTQTSGVSQVTETASPESSGFNVVLSSPANGASITPNIIFEGTYDNLKPGWSIHTLLIRGDKFFPIKDYYVIPDQTTGNNWAIHTTLSENPDDMGKAQSYSIVLAISLDDPSRELLSNSSETGIDINSLPSTVITFQDTSTVIYREAYKVIQELRLVYSLYDGTSYDLYTSLPDGSDVIQITFTPGFHEISPHLSPDGTQIVYIKYFNEGNGNANTYTISVMDSNGQNDEEVIRDNKNILERPQWSPDSAYISYTVGDTSQSPDETYWSIHVYGLSSKEDKIISGEPDININNRYQSWIPNSNTLVFNTGTQNTGTSGFVQISVDALEELSLFFDTKQDEIQPSIKILGKGYLLTYTVINPDFIHDVYAVIDLDGQIPFDGSPVKLTDENDGADLAILEPDSNAIYYIGTGNNIYRVEFILEGSKIELVRGQNTIDGQFYGELVIEVENGQRINSFDINYMDTFFPIQ